VNPPPVKDPFVFPLLVTKQINKLFATGVPAFPAYDERSLVVALAGANPINDNGIV
jgi:hypothetical protein